MKPLVRVSGLAVAIGDRELLSDIDLELSPGDWLGIAGETGSGKSLTCRALTGTLHLIGGRVTRGSIRLGDVELTALTERGWQHIRGRRVALVPQSSLSDLDPVMRVGRQLTETIRHLDPTPDARARAIELLTRVALHDPEIVYEAYPHELSGGMRQRVMIALAIAGRPEVLVADEPTTALDVTVQKEILELLQSLSRGSGMSVILVTHDLALVEQYADRIAIVYAGVTVEGGATDLVFREPQHPYTTALLDARPHQTKVGNRLVGISGQPPSPSAWPRGCRFAPRCARQTAECAVARPPFVRNESGGVACIHPGVGGR